MRVYIDSSLIVDRDWFLSTGPAEVLTRNARRGRVQVIVPEVVVREVVAAHERQFEQAEAQLRRASRTMARLSDPLGYEPPAPTEKRFMRRTYESWLRDHLSQNRVEVREIPEVSSALVERAVKRRRPFDGDGKKGFRDALIWETVLAGASNAQVSVIATDNRTDFGSADGGLHADLVHDLVGRGLEPGCVKLAPTLLAAAEIAVEPAREIVELLRQRLTSDDRFNEELAVSLQQELDSEWPAIDDGAVDVSVASENEAFLSYIVDRDLRDVNLTGAPSIDDAFPLTERTYAVQILVDTDVDYEIEVSTRGFTTLNRLPVDATLSGREDVAYFPGFASAHALFDARYDRETEELTNISLMGLYN